ncbi:MAG: SAM-dependent methyltransferase, partial [bacterium]
PGASAVVTALAVCGLPTDKFLFLGFMPHKKGKETMMRLMAEGKITSVFYESTHRILKTLNKMVEIIGESRKIVVCRELTKKFETIYRGSLKEVAEKLNNNIVKGEFVVIVSGNYEDKNKEIYE